MHIKCGAMKRPINSAGIIKEKDYMNYLKTGDYRELKTFMYFYSFPTGHRGGVSPPKIIAFTGDCESTIKRSITSLIDKGYLVEYEDVERTYKTAIPDRVIEAATAQRDY